MKESKIVGEEPNCEDDVTGVTELNADAGSTLDGLVVGLRDALRALRTRGVSEGIGAEHSVECPRCGMRTWPERAENDLWILVEEDGSAHSDACSPAEGQAEVVIHPLWPFNPFAT